ncbi:MAG: DUF4398 domain-containing protein, partial [bacterium]
MKSYRMNRVVGALLVFAVAALVYGCPKPDAEKRRAENAIKEAESAGAAEYAPSDLRSAEDALTEGDDLVDTLRYDKAREEYEQAYEYAMKAKREAIAAKSEPEPECEEEPEPEPEPEPQYTTRTVVKGDCLWWIAEENEVYGDPFQWPLIYWENQKMIDKTAHRYGHDQNEEDWIYPGQEFKVPQNNDMVEIKKARKRAGAPAPYTPPGSRGGESS